MVCYLVIKKKINKHEKPKMQPSIPTISKFFCMRLLVRISIDSTSTFFFEFSPPIFEYVVVIIRSFHDVTYSQMQ